MARPLITIFSVLRLELAGVDGAILAVFLGAIFCTVVNARGADALFAACVDTDITSRPQAETPAHKKDLRLLARGRSANNLGSAMFIRGFGIGFSRVYSLSFCVIYKNTN